MSRVRTYATKHLPTGVVTFADATSKPAAQAIVAANEYTTWIPTAREVLDLVAAGAKQVSAGVIAQAPQVTPSFRLTPGVTMPACDAAPSPTPIPPPAGVGEIRPVDRLATEDHEARV